MKIETIQTGQDHALAGKIHSPSRDAASVLVCVHGLGDHGGHFDGLAEAAADRDIATVTMDLRGHGDSPGRRGHAKSYDLLLRDLACLRRDIHQRFPNSPQSIIGHSMGGNLVVNYLLRRGEIDGSVEAHPHDAAPSPAAMMLLSPMFLPPQHVTRPQIFAAWLTGYLLPAIRVKKKAELSDLTTDDEQAAMIAGDPKRHGKLSIYLATQLLSQGRWALDNARQIDLPTLLIYGEEDTMVDRDAIENGAIRIGREATLVSWQHGRHDLLHDVDAEQVIARILTFCDSLRQQSVTTTV